MDMNELAIAVYLQTGFQKWQRAMARGPVQMRGDSMAVRSAFLGGAMFGQWWSGPASVRLDTCDNSRGRI